MSKRHNHGQGAAPVGPVVDLHLRHVVTGQLLVILQTLWKAQTMSAVMASGP
jgi:hypothetical protein